MYKITSLPGRSRCQESHQDTLPRTYNRRAFS